jgi:dipeptidyl aminopeptidase/acylaminoacyl peptidase
VGTAALVVVLGALLCAGAARSGSAPAVAVRGGDLYVGDRRLTSGPAEDAAPDWSPDRRRVAFSRTPARGRGAAIASVSRGGGGLRRLTSGESVDTQPAWSPDGGRIAYASADVSLGTFDLRVVDVGGGPSRLLVGGPADELAPAWSADGLRLRFVRLHADGRAERWEAAADGREARLLGPAAEPDWAEREADAGTPRTGPRELLPDLDQRPPSGVELRGTRLGFDSATDNVGDGPLWLVASRARRGDPMLVEQVVRLSDGGVRAYRDAGRLHFTVAPPHRHWHLRRFQQFELRRASDRRVVVRDRKVGFCLRDRYGVTARGVAARGAPVFVGNCAQDRPGALSVGQGTSPGYTDRYGAHFHGQNLELRGVPAGTYVLVHRANADGRLEELDYGNNAASLRIRLAWRGAVPVVAVLRRCPAGDRC